MLRTRPVFIGESRATQEALDLAAQASLTHSPVMITGENGTGKEILARTIHAGSDSREGRFVVTHCGAIPRGLIHSEIFGEEGQSGRLATDQHGSHYFDEIVELPYSLQGMLVESICKAQYSGMRILASTRHHLPTAVHQGLFREDLLALFSNCTIPIIPLRERSEDIMALAQLFLEKTNSFLKMNVSLENANVREALRRYPWPGNVRELENLMERLVIQKKTGALELADLPPAIFGAFVTQSTGSGALSLGLIPQMVLPERGLNLKSIVAAFENQLVDQALARTRGNKHRASELLIMNRTTLVEKLKKRGLITPAKSTRPKASTDHSGSPS